MLSNNYLFHLDLAAFFAISLRRFAVNFDALASPPFNPPRRPRLVAMVSSRGIRVSNGEPSICSPMACSTTDKAVAVKSSLVPFDLTLNGFTDPILTRSQEFGTGVEIQTDPLPCQRMVGTRRPKRRKNRDATATAASTHGEQAGTSGQGFQPRLGQGVLALAVL